VRAVVALQGPPLNVVGGLFGGKTVSIGIAEADFQAVAHAVAGLGHRLFTCSARRRFVRFSLLYEGTLYATSPGCVDRGTGLLR